MLKNKLAAAGMAGMLAMSLGLVACGGNEAAPAEEPPAEETTTTTETTTESTDTSATTTSEVEDESPIAFWAGALEDGSEVVLSESNTEDVATLAITPADGSESKSWDGSVTVEEGADTVTATITDGTTNEQISYTIVNIDKETGVLEVEIEGYGKASLVSITENEFNEMLENFATDVEEAVADGTITEEAPADEATTEEAAV